MGRKAGGESDSRHHAAMSLASTATRTPKRQQIKPEEVVEMG